MDTRGRLKPEYDAVVVGAGKVGWAGVEGPEGSLPRILGWWGGVPIHAPALSLLWHRLAGIWGESKLLG